MKSSKKWSEILVRSSLSGFLVDRAIEESNGVIDGTAEELLRCRVEERAQVRNLRHALRSIRKGISPETFDALNEELEEIAEDFTWKKSERGRYLSAVNDWVQTFHASIRSESRFDDLYVGGHAELEVVYVVGSCESEADLKDFLSLVKRNDPPRKVLTNVRVKN